MGMEFFIMLMDQNTKVNGLKIKNTDFGYYDLLNPKPNFTQFETKKEDIETIKAWCDSMSSDKLFLPKRGLISYCASCPFDSPCSKWNINSKKESQKNA